MLCENPIVIQDEESYDERVPLFLIHDGGGTVFSYFLIGALGRRVHGISNPYYGTNQKWEEGIPGIAKSYAQMIKETMSSGKILLGGWSLGGLISIEIAHIFSQDPDIDVAGIVMIDSVCPLDKAQLSLDSDCAGRLSNIRRGTAHMAKTCMNEAVDMIQKWTLPIWDSSPISDPRKQLRRRISQMEKVRARNAGVKPESLSPPTVLLRAAESNSGSSSPYSSTSSSAASTPMSVSASSSSSSLPLSSPSLPSLSGQDTKSNNTLGWDQYASLLLRQTFDVPGNHFSLFDSQNVLELTKTLKTSCDMLAERCELGAACRVN